MQLLFQLWKHNWCKIGVKSKKVINNFIDMHGCSYCVDINAIYYKNTVFIYISILYLDICSSNSIEEVICNHL